VIKKVYFCGVTRVDKVLESSNFGKPPLRCMQPARDTAT